MEYRRDSRTLVFDLHRNSERAQPLDRRRPTRRREDYLEKSNAVPGRTWLRPSARGKGGAKVFAAERFAAGESSGGNRIPDCRNGSCPERVCREVRASYQTPRSCISRTIFRESVAQVPSRSWTTPHPADS